MAQPNNDHMRRSSISLLLAMAAMVLATDAAQAQNAYLTNGFMPRFCKGSTNYPIVVRVRNSVATPLISFKLDWRWNNGPVQEGNWQSTTGISGNQYWEYPHPTPFNQPGQGPGVLKVWVQGLGDTDPSNDTLSFNITPLTNWAEKTQLLEIWTATWCQFCPPANILGNVQNDDPMVVVAKYHANDEFSNGSSTTYFDQYNVTFTPGGVIEQGEYGSYQPNANHGFWTNELDQRGIGVSPVAMEITTDYNATSRRLSATMNATFTAALAGEYTVNLFIVEDNVPGPQNNAPANYVHQQVVRHVMEGPTGFAGAIPATPVAGTSYPRTWDHILATDIVPQNVRVIGIVTHRLNGTSYTLNAISSAPLVVSVDELDALGAIRAYPNPGNDVLWVELPADGSSAVLQLFSSDGRLLLEQRAVANGAPVRMAGYEALSAGAYLLRMERNGMVVDRRVVRTE